MDLPHSQRQAVEAYRGGFISIGRLAEVMGMHVLELRQWLAEHAIDENFSLGVGLELSDSRGLVKSYDTFEVGRCQTVRRREVGMPRIGV